MCQLRTVRFALLLAKVLAESPTSCAPGPDGELPSTQAPSMVQTKMQRRLALAEGADGLQAAALQLASARRGGLEHQESLLQEASNLVSIIRSLGAAMNSTDNTTQHLKDIDQDQLANIKDIINKTFFGNLLNLSAEDQAEVNSDHQFLTGCDTPLKAALNGTVASALATLDASRRSHKTCRTTEAAAYTDNATAWAAYSALVQSIAVPPACPTYTQNLASMEQFFDTSANNLYKWYEDNGPVFSGKQAAFRSANQQLRDDRARCHRLQGEMEQDYCFYQTKLKSTCGAYDTCHTSNLAKYTATKARVMLSETTRKSLYKSGAAIVCHLDVILTGSKGHDTCTTDVSNLDTSSLDIAYPAQPSKSSCDISSVAGFPCDAGWVSAEFSWMPQGTAAAACSRCPSETPAPTPAPTPVPPSPAPTPVPLVSSDATWTVSSSARWSVSEAGRLATRLGPHDWQGPSVMTGTKMTAGRFYYEVELVGHTDMVVGVVRYGASAHHPTYYTKDSWWIYAPNGARYSEQRYINAPVGAYNAGDRVGVLVDLDQGSVLFFKNGVKHGPGFGAGQVTPPVVLAVDASTKNSGARLIVGAAAPSGY